jgi:DNA primase
MAGREHSDLRLNEGVARVSPGLPSDAKEQVRQAIDIVDLVGDYLQLRREGRGYKAHCPWHDDSRPSLQVNPDRQSFRCWVCDIGGDVFSFVMKYENVSFPEALEMLADRAGIKLEQTSGPPAEDKRLLYQAMAWAEEQFHACLTSPEGAAARDYLASRNIKAGNLDVYRLGYSPPRWDWLLERAHGTRFSPKVLETVGLIGKRANGPGYYDRFRGRVLFPIHDVQGRPVGIGGRIMPGVDDPAKYVNSPETPLFSKSSLVYGLDHAKPALAKTHTALVMEGYTDCLIAHQHGFKHAVAVLGTALGPRHIKLLRRFVERIVLVLDGDDAGRRRADQILELFVAEQMDLRILTLPDDLDPADFLLERGAAAFEERIGGAVEALDHEFARQTASLTATSGTHERTAAVERVLATLAKAPRLQDGGSSGTRLKEDQLLIRLAQLSGIDETRLRTRLTELRRGGTRPAKRKEEASLAPAPEEAGKLVLAERWLLRILLQAPETLDEIRAAIAPERFCSPQRAEVFRQCCRLADSGVTPTFERLMLELEDAELKSLVVALDEERQKISRDDIRKELTDLLRVFCEENPGRQPFSRSAAPTQSSGNQQADVDALRRLIERERHRQGISTPTDG